MTANIRAPTSTNMKARSGARKMRQDTKKFALVTGASSGTPPLQHGEQCSRFGPLAARSPSNSGKRYLRPDNVAEPAETIQAHPQTFFMKSMTRVICAALMAAFFVATGFAAAAALRPPAPTYKGPPVPAFTTGTAGVRANLRPWP
jgi:hypothetical protein